MAQVKALIGNIKGPAGKDGENFSIYSTNEQVVGKWINGKPIYRKCFKNVAFSNLDATSGRYIMSTKIDIDNIDKIISIHGETHTAIGTDYELTSIFPSVNIAYDRSIQFCSYVMITNSNYMIYIAGNNGFIQGNCYIDYIVEYTKTTDTATT